MEETRDGDSQYLFVYIVITPVKINYVRKFEREEKNDRIDVFEYKRSDLMVCISCKNKNDYLKCRP